MDPSVIYKRTKAIFCISVIGLFIDGKVELDRVHSQDSHFIKAIEGFGLAKLEFGRFDYCR